MLLCLIIVKWLNVLDLIVYHRVEVLFDDKLFPNLDDLLKEGFCFANGMCAFLLEKFAHIIVTTA